MGNHTSRGGTGAYARRQALRETTYAPGATRNFIARSQIAAWTSGNAPQIPTVGVHYGTPEHIARLKRDGIDVTRNFRGVYGAGFYMYNPAGLRKGSDIERDARHSYGTERVAVAIRMRNPYSVPDSAFSHFQDQLAAAHPDVRPYTQQFYQLITSTLRKQGYDGIAVWDDEVGPKASHIVAIVQGSVRIVR